MKIALIGDMHEGKRFPLTTAATALSFQRLREDAWSTIMDIPDIAHRISLGDLFDGFSASGDTLVSAYVKARQLSWILAGNHDQSNNTDRPSAIQYLKDIFGMPVVIHHITAVELGATLLMLVPHHLTQEGFEAALDRAKYSAKTSNHKHKVLLLHCNYGLREGSETENYLRPEMAKSLLEVFTHIFSGHEHNRNTPLKGVRMVGSILPFSFGEMKDKSVVVFDTETGLTEEVLLWSEKQFQPWKWREDNVPPSDGCQFLEITGSVTVEQASAINKYITSKYKEGHIIAIKNSTTLIRHERQAEAVEDLTEWTEEVKKQLNPEQQDLLNEMLGAKL